MMMAGNSSKKLHAIQLGFSVELEEGENQLFVGHKSANWRDWDGGQIGGRPSWLQPRDLPNDSLLCLNCQEPMSFVCQLYAPADEVSSNAFHRSIYVFGCPNAQCAQSTTGSIRVLRAQLPRENEFYPEDEEETETWAMHLPEAWEVSLCRVCGQRGHGKCPIQGFNFCGKQCQKQHKKYIFDKLQQLSKQLDFSFLPSVYAESELVVEEEPSGGLSEETMGEKADNALFGTSNSDDEDDEDKDLEQEDLNEMTGAAAATVSKDPISMAFYSRINDKPNVQEQCLRYLRWPDQDLASESNMPLWMSSENLPDEIPDCPYCGAERNFEFQLMPQMLHYLMKDHVIHRAKDAVKESLKTDEAREAVKTATSIMEQAPKEQIPPSFADAKAKAVEAVRTQLMAGDNELNWGVVSVYTCTKSCGGAEANEGLELGAYREEYAWKQPSLD